MLEYLLKKYKNRPTCSVVNQVDGAVTFVRDLSYIGKYILDSDKDLIVLATAYLKKHDINISDNIKFYFVDNPEYMFTLFHNEVNKDKITPPIKIGNNTKIHETVVMNVEGLKVVNAPNGTKLQFIHTGNIIIGNDVEIGSYSVIHRGTMDSTIIGNGVKTASFTNIGHNNIIGDNTILAARVTTNGSVTIGRNCWISSSVNIKNGINICDNVVIGMGSNVVKDVETPGIYVGTPLRKIKEYKEGWNF